MKLTVQHFLVVNALLIGDILVMRWDGNEKFMAKNLWYFWNSKINKLKLRIGRVLYFEEPLNFWPFFSIKNHITQKYLSPYALI